MGGPKKPPDPPKLTDPAIAEARRRQQIAAARRKGRASTILTSGQGLVGDGGSVGHAVLSGSTGTAG